jgi:uncharacterized protein (TIGR02246 family)
MKAESKTAAEAVPEILQTYVTSIVEGDPDRWISNWTEDCVQLPPGGPMVIGREELYESISAWLDAFEASEFELQEPAIEQLGDLAFSWVTYSYKVSPKDGSPGHQFHGKALTVYKRQPDGTWKIHRDCFNSNTPNPMD